MLAEQLFNATDYAELEGVELEFLHERADLYRYQTISTPTGGVTQQWALQQSAIPAGRELIRHPVPYTFVNGQYSVVVPVWLELAPLTDVRAQDRVLYNDGTWYQVLGQPGTTTDELYRRAWGVVLLPGAVKPASVAEAPDPVAMHAYISGLEPEPGVVIPIPGDEAPAPEPETETPPVPRAPATAPFPPLAPAAPVDAPPYRTPAEWVLHV